MKQIFKTQDYSQFFTGIKDATAKAKILVRIKRLKQGNAGDVKPIGKSCSELRIDYGPGYRVYFKEYGEAIVLLLCGGDKSTQVQDIELAKKLADNLDEILWEEES
jgi:putative addiction module killer protein